MIEACHETNKDGAGAAWREGGKVHWKKGLLGPEEMLEIAETKPLPFILHFRIPTVGGKRKELAHPFLISKGSSLELEGTTKDYVLFHNGHWGRWKETSIEAAVKSNTKLPPGKWSDSRAMAWVASIYGLGLLDWTDEKFVAFGPGQDDIEVSSHGWTLVEGVWASNTAWQHKAAWNRRNTSSNTAKTQEVVDHRPHQGSVGGYHTTPPHSLPTGFEGRVNRGGAVDAQGNKVEEVDDDDHLVVWRGIESATSPNHGFPHNNQGGKHKKGSGGSLDQLPFGQIHPAVAERLWKAGELSHKKFKRHRAAWEKNQRNLEKAKARKGPILH